MKVIGSYKPKAYEYERLHDGTALIRLYENIHPYTKPATETEPEEKGWTFDRYTITRRHEAGLEARIKANVSGWLNIAKQEEYDSLAAEVREVRNEVLEMTDWTQILDAPISPCCREAMREYRQELRDVTEQDNFPYDVEWPEEPPIEKGDPDPVDDAFDELVGGGDDE